MVDKAAKPQMLTDSPSECFFPAAPYDSDLFTLLTIFEVTFPLPPARELSPYICRELFFANSGSYDVVEIGWGLRSCERPRARAENGLGAV